jgi:hypothetical protein
MTPLDEALLAAQGDPALVDQFYGLFLSTLIVVPIYESPPNLPVDAGGRLEEATPMRPIVIPDGELQYIPIFDSLDKLVSWAQQEVQYMQVPAHAFLEGLHPSVYLALNPGHELAKEFVPDEIAWLKTWVDTQVQKTTIQAGTKARIEAPKRIPHAMQSKLFEYFGQTPEIKSAYLAKCQYEGKPIGWILVVEAKGRKIVFETLAKEIGLALQGTLGSQVSLDIIPKQGEDLDLAVTQAVQPFYIRPSFH